MRPSYRLYYASCPLVSPSVRLSEPYVILSQWRIQKGRGGVWKKGSGNVFKILCKNNAFLCKMFTCFKMHPVNRGGAAAFNSPLFRSTAEKPKLMRTLYRIGIA